MKYLYNKMLSRKDSTHKYKNKRNKIIITIITILKYIMIQIDVTDTITRVVNIDSQHAHMA